MDALGINLTWFLFQLGNFIILTTGLTWLLHKPLLKLLDDRKKEVAEGLKNAEEAGRQLQIAERHQAEILESARKESLAMLKATKQEAEELKSELKKAAQIQIEGQRKATEEQIAAEGQLLRQELKKELAGMVVQATEKVLRESVSEDTRKAVTRNVKHL